MHRWGCISAMTSTTPKWVPPPSTTSPRHCSTPPCHRRSTGSGAPSGAGEPRSPTGTPPELWDSHSRGFQDPAVAIPGPAAAVDTSQHSTLSTTRSFSSGLLIRRLRRRSSPQCGGRLPAVMSSLVPPVAVRVGAPGNEPGPTLDPVKHIRDALCGLAARSGPRSQQR